MAETTLALTIKAFDKASGPIKALTAKLNTLTAPSRDFAKNLGDLSKAANLGGLASGFAGVGSAAKNVAGEALSLGGKLLAMASAASFAFYSVTRGAVDAGDKLGEMSARVGLGVDAYASLQYAAAQADVEQEQFNAAMDQFNKRLGEAKAGGGSLLTFLEKVSPRLAEQVKNAKGTEAALSLMTDAFARIDDPAKRAALAAEAFGKSGLQMGNFLNQGGAAIQKQQVAYLALAGSQEKFARGAGDLDNVLRDSETAFLGLRSAAAVALFPAITKLASAVTQFMTANRDGLQRWAEKTGAALSQWVDGGGLDRLFAGLTSVAGAVVRVVDALGPFGVALAASVPLVAPLIGSIVSLGGSLYSLGAAVAPFLVAAWPFIAAAAPFIAAAVGIAAAGKAIHDNWADLTLIFREFWSDLNEKFPLLSRFLDGAGSLAKFGAFGPLGAAAMGLKEVATTGRGLFDDAPKPFNAAGARPQTLRSTNDARVSVDFSNLPRGARVTADPTSSQPVDLDVGYSMATP